MLGDVRIGCFYDADCRLLFRDEPPAFDVVSDRLQALAEKL